LEVVLLITALLVVIQQLQVQVLPEQKRLEVEPVVLLVQPLMVGQFQDLEKVGRVLLVVLANSAAGL
jgi:hypothetical protein